MLCIPYLDAKGRPVSLKFRDLRMDAHPKYHQPAGQTPRLFNVSALVADVEAVAICEGEMDAVLLTQLGIPAVGLPGTSIWGNHWPRCFVDYQTVFVVADNDKKEDKVDVKTGEKVPNNPGMKHAERVLKSLDGRGRMVRPPFGLDLTDWVLAAGAGEVLAHFA